MESLLLTSGAAVLVLWLAWSMVRQPKPRRSRGPYARFVREPQRRMTYHPTKFKG
jgi:hypothetical protein